jgi:hypothetical protein
MPWHVYCAEKRVLKAMKAVIDVKKSNYTSGTHPKKNQVCKVSLTASFLGSKVRQKIICEKSIPTKTL